MNKALVALVAIIFLPSLARANENDDAAEKRVKELGGKTSRHEDLPGKPLKSIDLSKTKVTDEDLKLMAKLNQLRILNLDNTVVSDAGLMNLPAVTSLSNLSLFGTKVTKEGVAKLKKSLEKTQIQGP